MKLRKKLIEVALPLEAINVASAREKSIRHGHPSTLHLWWARRPLAAARAVIFSQMVDDPSDCPEDFPTETAQQQERERLFRLIEQLVLWENTTNEDVLEQARAEMRRSWRRACADNADHPRATELFDPATLPAFHDPFAGGGALPLEAQRLGLESHASDLNPVAVLINKAMIEIPPKFAGRTPVNPAWREQSDTEQMGRNWSGARGLADDVRYYGQWMRDEAEKRIGHLYPRAEVTAEMVNDRPDLRPYLGKSLTVIAWIWARTVKSPNPAFSNVDVPLASTFMLSTKAGKEAYVEPIIENGGYRFTVKKGRPQNSEVAKNGTKSSGSHSAFLCLMSGTPMPFEFLRAEGKAGRLGARLMAIVAEGNRGRVYLTPTYDHEDASLIERPDWRPEIEISHWPGRTNVVEYGLNTFAHLFTPRQLTALTTFSDLVQEAIAVCKADAVRAGLPDDGLSLDFGGTGSQAYSEAVGVYLAFAVDKITDRNSSICGWDSSRDSIRGVFGRQAIPMVWDFAESNTVGVSAGSYGNAIDQGVRVLNELPGFAGGSSYQSNASVQTISHNKVISTDPPYYDNIGYADLSDFFYVWLRKSLRPIYPDLFSTVSVPKAEELVATPYRHGGKENAERFFLDGMTEAMRQLADQANPVFPVTIYYAFKQSETSSDAGTASTGWETFLQAVIRAGFSIHGTWPMRTELGNRMIGSGTNALASSIVLVCRKRPDSAFVVTRGEFVSALKSELPMALRRLQEGNIAPVDLAQAAIGPGMAVYSRYAQVLNAQSEVLSVRDALVLINEILDETLSEQEGDFDSETRFALAWFDQNGFSEGEFGTADVLARAKNTAVNALVESGLLISSRGKVRLLSPAELPASWDPATDSRLTTWECVHHLIRAQQTSGEAAAADLLSRMGSRADIARELSYRLFSISERRRRAEEALWYNALVQSWGEFKQLAADTAQRRPTPVQRSIFDQEES